MKPFQISHTERGAVQLVQVGGALDMHSFPRLESELRRLFNHGHHRLVLDCEGLDYIGSAGLGALIGFAKEAREHEGDLRLLNVPPHIYRIIELLGFTKVLQVHTEETAAIASFQPK